MTNKYTTFIFDSYNFDIKTKTLLLKYSYNNELFFEEKIEFPSNKILKTEELQVLDNIFKYIHLACGISYYKLFVVSNIKINTFELNKEQAEFFNNFYFNGLGEFACKNNIIDLKDRINFPYNINIDNTASNIDLINKIVVPIGGGKDSTTTLEIIKTFKDTTNILTCSIGIAKSIEETIKISGCKSFHPKRTISSKLLELNKILDQIGGYNGHVPISGILAFIMSACAIIYNFDTILMSNERSANVGNKEFANVVVNHQWSKSFEFEKEINNFFKKYLLTNLNYISFLRPLSEIHIAKLFSKLTQYHEVFTSCNKNFKIENRLEHWCCDCDKCRFVFLILSVFLNKKQLTNIFGKNLFEDKTQLEGFKELCGVSGFKPFECVGEIEESAYSMLKVNESFKDDFVVKTLQPLLVNVNVEELEKSLFSLSNEHLLNDELFNVLNKYINNLE